MNDMRDQWTDRLSEYVDGELTGEERAAIESHLAGCPGCAATLDDLKCVLERAGTMGPRPPQADLWPAIADRIASPGWLAAPKRASAEAGGPLQSSASPAPQQAQAAPGDARAVDVARGSDIVPDPAVRFEPVSLADAQYDAAVADLERALAKGRGHLDKATIAIVTENLRIIDQAIAQARTALAADPANSYLSSHLVETRRKKLDLLRRAAALTSETN